MSHQLDFHLYLPEIWYFEDVQTCENDKKIHLLSDRDRRQLRSSGYSGHVWGTDESTLLLNSYGRTRELDRRKSEQWNILSTHPVMGRFPHQERHAYVYLISILMMMKKQRFIDTGFLFPTIGAKKERERLFVSLLENSGILPFFYPSSCCDSENTFHKVHRAQTQNPTLLAGWLCVAAVIAAGLPVFIRAY